MNKQPTEAPYGRWKSRFEPATLAGLPSVSEPVYGPAGQLVWIESTAEGRLIRTRLPDGRAGPDLAKDHAPGGRVGYGGGAFTLGQKDLHFVDGACGRLRRQPLSGGPAVAITPPFGGAASPTVSPDGGWVMYVHSDGEIDSLAAGPADGRFWPAQLASGPGFFMQPAWHPDGRHVAWVQWNHPVMPWDSTELCLARLQFETGRPPIVTERKTLAGSPQASALQPSFSPDGANLAYLSDREGRWTLYLHHLASGATKRLIPHGWICGGPPWVHGLRFFDFAPDGRLIYAILSENGTDTLWQLPVGDGQPSMVLLPAELTALSQISARPDRDGIAFLASGVTQPPGVYTWSSQAGLDRVAGPSMPALVPDLFSQPNTLEWAGEDGEKVYGLYFAAHNPGYVAEGLPPLVIHIHSGPTSQARVEFEPGLQFFTSRGYAVLAVNYRGSAGYGRAYRQALHGNWGVVDVADVVSGAAYAATQGLADPTEITLIGGSAGGFTALMALARHPGRFKAAICRYPVTQHSVVPAGHKFERYYDHSLLGALPAQAEVYRERAPFALADHIQDPVLLFHGTDDPVIPERDSAKFVARLRANGVPCGYQVFEGEGHGFRRPENIETYYRMVTQFLELGVPPQEVM